MVHYRQATVADLDLVVALMLELVDELDPGDGAARIKALLPADLELALRSPQAALFLAIDGDVGVGLSRGDVLTQDPIFRLRCDHRCGYIDQMYVAPTHRGLQVGQALLACCERWFAEQGIHHVLLHAAPRAVRFYARCGYQPNREMFKALS